MANPENLPISRLPAATFPLSGAELLACVQAGVTKRTNAFAIVQLPVPATGGVLVPGRHLVITTDTISFCDPFISQINPGELTLTNRLQARELKAMLALELPAETPECLLIAGVPCDTDNDIKRSAPGELTINKIIALVQITIPGTNIRLASDGTVTGDELHASNGFSGTGAFTNFTIVDGIIVGAS